MNAKEKLKPKRPGTSTRPGCLLFWWLVAKIRLQIAYRRVSKQKKEAIAQISPISKTIPKTNVGQLIDRLFIYDENHQQVIAQIISMGSAAFPELLTFFHNKEFGYLQSETDTDHNTARLIAKCIVEIARNEQDPAIRDRLSLEIINEMGIHAQWYTEVSVLDRELFEKAFDESLFHKACEAARAMGQLKDSRALPHLFKVIENKHSHPTIRENAITALGQIGDEQAIPVLIDLIDRKNFNYHFAVDALAKMGKSAAVPYLLASLEKMKWGDEEQASIIWALGQLHDSRATPILTEWTKTHTADMKAVAIQALGGIGDPAAIPALEACLDDDTVLHRQDWGGTFWLFRTYRERKICEMALESLKNIGTPEALNVIEKWQSSQTK
jgi:hypothetical protein